ncbi:MAG: hypothetical protein GW778_05380 [Alphaproteobacteria bacterium]|nr:hypothetical protein [Alphaproteobacteria bacterium]
MRKLTTILCAAMIIIPNFASASERIEEILPDAKIIGEGRLTYLLWDVYDAALYAPNGMWRDDEPFALKLSYLMDIEGKKIADRSVVEMRHQQTANEVQLAAWHAQMCKIFPKVQEGETITGVYTKNKETVFYKGDQEIGRIKDPKFSKAFFGIWLSKDTNAPDLRRKLLSGNATQMAGKQ